MTKTATLTITYSTNPSGEGRYFADLRDTTNGENRQMATLTRDANDMIDYVIDVCRTASHSNVLVSVVDMTGEIEAAIR